MSLLDSGETTSFSFLVVGTMAVQIGYAEGVCSNCGKTLMRRRPVDIAVCDCYEYCPLCGNKMQPYTPDLTPSTYGPIESEEAQGDTGKPLDVFYYCLNCRYYSAQKPVEVRLT